MSVWHKNLTGADLHEPKGAATASSGQVYVSDGAGSGIWQNPLSSVVNLNSFDVNGVIEDVSTADDSYYIRFTRDCSVSSIYGVLSGAITVADSEISLYRDGILLGQTISIPYSGSGDGVKITKTLSPTYTFTTGQVLKLKTDGASTDAASFYFTVKCAV